MPTIRTAASKLAKLTPTEADSNMKRTPVEKAADYTLDATHNREFHYLTTSVATVTLPDISAITIETGDWEITLYNTLSTSVTVDRNSQNINGAASNLTLAPGQVVTLCADATPDGFYTKTFKDPTTTRGDLMVRGASSLSRLAVGTSGYFLRSDGTDAAWAVPYYAVTAYRTTNISIPNNTYTDLPFTSETHDSGSLHDTTSNQELFVAPSWATKMRMTGTIRWDVNATGVRGFKVVTSAGANLTPNHTVLEPAVSSSTSISINISTGLLNVTGGSSYKIQVYQNSGGNLAISGNFGETYVTVEFFP